MSDTVISVENVSKAYRLGQIGGGTLKEDFARYWAKLRGKPDPNLKIGEEHHARKMGEQFWALDNVSFEVRQGEVLGIIGRNGAGKSTLLKILSQVTTPTSGQIKIKGRIASLLEVGTGFNPEMTGRENVFLNGAILGMTKAEIRGKFDEIVAFSGVEEFIDTPVKRYSSGMYVRLAFAVAAHLEPEILIVDEVLAVGDAEFQKKCMGKMKDVAEHGRTILFVSHNLKAVSTLTTRCVYLANGTVNFIGSTGDAVERYVGSGQDDNPIYSEKLTTNTSQPRICSVQLKTSLPGNIHFNNDPIEILIKLHTPRPIEGTCLTVQVFDSDQVNYVHLWIEDARLPMCRQPGFHLLKCIIPQFHLFMGNYRLRVFFAEPPGGELFQTLEGICPFEVITRDNSRLFPWQPKECAYIEKYRWESSFLKDR